MINWRTEKRKVKDLVPWDKNPRKITDKEKDDLRAGLESLGLMSIPVIDTKNTLISGHQRTAILMMLERGEEEIDVRVPDRELTEEEFKEANLRENQNGGSFDWDKLKTSFDVDMLLKVGFGDEELSTMWDNVDLIDDLEGTGMGGGEEEPVVPRMNPGEVWALGDHRLMNGDSTKREDVAKLMGDEKANMIYCDPPYNIGLDYSDGINAKGKYGGSYDSGNDSQTDTEYAEFVGMTMDNALEFSKKNVHMFYWCDEKYIGLFQAIMAKAGATPRRVCLWVKNHFNMTPQIAFNKCYEPCVYGTRGTPHLDKKYHNLNEILNPSVESGNQVHEEVFDILNIWLVKRDNSNEYIHPTQKPLTLHQKPLRRCTAPGHIVMDLFGGSGSTLVACEQMSRKARLMERDPIFCEKIIKRWEELTGKTAKKIS